MVASPPAKTPRTRYQQIADRLSDEAERNAEIHTYISAEDVARALGDDKYDVEDSPWASLTKWITERRLLGFEPTTDDVLSWVEDQP